MTILACPKRGLPPYSDMSIGNARLDFGYTQMQVSTAAGLHYSTVSRISGKEEYSRFKVWPSSLFSRTEAAP